jgi:Fe(3+) dicitrate transport protein
MQNYCSVHHKDNIMHKHCRNFLLLCTLSLPVEAQEVLEAIEVSEKYEHLTPQYWEENVGTQILSGKKNTITNLKDIPKLQTNNYRQASFKTPGLLISEIPNESLAALTYRGLGDPHESAHILLLQDGIPVAADMFGYPAHYYAPALPMVDKFQFIRGGSALHYGPQPGGAVNYLSRPLKRTQASSGYASVAGGSFNLLTTNHAVYGKIGDHAYGIEFYRRQGDGPQKINSDFNADYVQIRDHIFKGQNTFKISFNGYNSDHGETGGFAKRRGVNLNTFGDDQTLASKRYDRLKVHRAQLSVAVDRRIDETSLVEVKFWGTAYNRYSKRQNQDGGLATFGALYSGTTNQIVDQRYFGYNGEVRYLKNYMLFGNEQTFSAGLLSYNLLSPLVIETGNRPDANHGTVTRRTARATHTNSSFAENRFAFGNFLITPGIRVENIRQIIEERKGGALREKDNQDVVPLLGIGLSYHATNESQIYANVSEAYKPLTWADAIATNVNETVAGDIEASKTLNSEIGHRGQTDTFNWDVSVFFIRYENRIAKIGTEYTNSGGGTHQGVDAAGEFKLKGSFNVYANTSFLNAKFSSGPLKNLTPQYAPKNISRVGIIYHKEDQVKIALMGVFLSRHYANDNNGNGPTTNSGNDFEIPAYSVFDLTGDWHISKEWMLSAGLNNLLNKNYYSRIRSDGVIWSLGRNFYAGLTYQF